MGREVIDTNVLTIATALHAGWGHPRIPLAEIELVRKVFEWVRAFKEDPSRHLVMDQGRTIRKEYASRNNMPDFFHYGLQVVQHKFDTNATCWVDLEYWDNGDERVARLPEEVEPLVHDLGDRKMIAAAAKAGACIVNACDSDWTGEKEQRALKMMGVEVVQILSESERAHCKGR